MTSLSRLNGVDKDGNSTATEQDFRDESASLISKVEQFINTKLQVYNKEQQIVRIFSVKSKAFSDKKNKRVTYQIIFNYHTVILTDSPDSGREASDGAVTFNNIKNKSVVRVLQASQDFTDTDVSQIMFGADTTQYYTGDVAKYLFTQALGTYLIAMSRSADDSPPIIRLKKLYHGTTNKRIYPSIIDTVGNTVTFEGKTGQNLVMNVGLVAPPEEVMQSPVKLKEYADIANRVLDIILDKAYFDSNGYKEWDVENAYFWLRLALVQHMFEYRQHAIAALLVRGEKGTGKSMFTGGILSMVFSDAIQGALPDAFDTDTIDQSWKRNNVVVADDFNPTSDSKLARALNKITRKIQQTVGKLSRAMRENSIKVKHPIFLMISSNAKYPGSFDAAVKNEVDTSVYVADYPEDQMPFTERVTGDDEIFMNTIGSDIKALTLDGYFTAWAMVYGEEIYKKYILNRRINGEMVSRFGMDYPKTQKFYDLCSSYDVDSISLIIRGASRLMEYSMVDQEQDFDKSRRKFRYATAQNMLLLLGLVNSRNVSIFSSIDDLPRKARENAYLTPSFAEECLRRGKFKDPEKRVENILSHNDILESIKTKKRVPKILQQFETNASGLTISIGGKHFYGHRLREEGYNTVIKEINFKLLRDLLSSVGELVSVDIALATLEKKARELDKAVDAVEDKEGEL